MKIYLSHTIRGKYGDKAIHIQMKENCNKALTVGDKIRKALPTIDLYIPAEHEEFVERAYDKKYLTGKQILEIDCDIVETCEAVIVLLENQENYPQGGRLIEYDYAVAKNIPIITFYEDKLSDVIEWITYHIMRN